MAKQYYARICWNSNGWRFPTGDATNLEHDTYAAEYGFGHEEWLFNFTWPHEGYHYAFLQPVSKSSRKMKGKALDILLWAINPNKQHVQIGRIRNCEVLTKSQAQSALKFNTNAGRLKQMEQDVARVGGEIGGLESDGLFNIRFRREDAIQYDDPYPVAEATDKIAKLKRYTLVEAEQSDRDLQLRIRTRQGSTTVPSARIYTKTGSHGSTVDPYHPILQARLMKLLQAHFGKDKVVRESDRVDITVIHGKKRMLIEIKTDPVAKRAIREALGQILEYAFFSSVLRGRQDTGDAELFIVAPGLVNEEVSRYLNLLREKFSIPIQYCSFSAQDELPVAFKQSRQ